MRRCRLLWLLGLVPALAACSEDPDRTPSGSSGPPPSGPYELCVHLINQHRDSIGRPPLARWTEAESCADYQAQSDAATNDPHGAFGQCNEWAQNECPGWSGPAEDMIEGCLDMMWAEGPGGGHYENMASTQYTSVACGFYETDNGSVWAVQDFR